MADIVSMRADAEAARKRIDEILNVDGELSTGLVAELEEADTNFRKLQEEIKRFEVVDAARESLDVRNFEPRAPKASKAPAIDSRMQFQQNLRNAIRGTGPREDRAAIEGTGSGDNAEALMPVDLQDTMIRVLTDVSAVRQAATVASYDVDVELPVVTSRAEITAYTGESAAFDDINPEFQKLRIRSFKSAAETKITDEVLADSRGGVVAETLTQHAEAHALFWESQYLGTGVPQNTSNVDGLLANTGFSDAFGFIESGVPRKPADVDSGGNTAFSQVDYDDLIATTLAMPAQYWNLPKSWIVGPAMYEALIKLEDTGGRKLYQPQSLGALPDAPNIPTLLGYPVYVSSQMPSTAGAGVFAAILLERGSYMVADRTAGGQVQSQVDPFTYGGLGQTAYRTFVRSDGRWIRPESSARLTL